jgi:K(+)-stimulated pyrophosphate-energized sodium pump
VSDGIKVALGASLLCLLFVTYLIRSILRANEGSAKMREISGAIQDGARTFLRREYSVVAVVVIIVAIFLCCGPLFGTGGISIDVDWKTAVAFVVGALASALAGYLAMWVGTRANGRTAQAAREGLKPALTISFSGGATTGLSIVGVALLGLCLVYVLFEGKASVVNGYAMGASMLALFARAGGGIYTKGADMGADLVGKVESGIPEDDPRNPAVIADNVGDNVGDTAGLGADLLESYVESIIACVAIGTIILNSCIAATQGILHLPMFLASLGIVASILGVLWVRLGGANDPQRALNTGVYVSAIIMAIGTFFIVRWINLEYTENGTSYGGLGPFWAVLAGLVSGIIIGLVSEIYTSSRYRSVRELARSAETGPAVVIVHGLSIGMASTFIPVVVIAAATMVGFTSGGMYGVALAALGMLSILGITLAVDSYGPVADNAGGIAQMAGLEASVRDITDRLDAVGNTTAAIGKGFAIGSAAFAALGLFTAYLATVNNVSPERIILSIANPQLVAGLLVGGMIPFLLSSMLARGVGTVAFRMIGEVRRQFKEITGLMEGTARADSSRCVDIATRGAIRAMMVPGILAIVIPIGIGFLMGPVVLAGFLIGSLVTGLQLGIFTANSGAALDNAKKYIEEGNFGGKGSDAHKAAVVGDTVGDPLKDTVGPSINILIKLMTVVSLVLAPLFVAFRM